jgi:hypothetical protein
MKKGIRLLTTSGQTIKITLDGWGGGTDRYHRRWTLAPEGWRCVDNGEVAQGMESLISHPMKLGEPRHR